MGNVRWVKIRSWHISMGWQSRGGQWKLACGRFAAGDELDDRGTGKTCESCLRVAGPK